MKNNKTFIEVMLNQNLSEEMYSPVPAGISKDDMKQPLIQWDLGIGPTSFISDHQKYLLPKLAINGKEKSKIAKVVVAFSQSKSSILGAKQAFDLNLVEPIFVGPKDKGPKVYLGYF